MLFYSGMTFISICVVPTMPIAMADFGFHFLFAFVAVLVFFVVFCFICYIWYILFKGGMPGLVGIAVPLFYVLF